MVTTQTSSARPSATAVSPAARRAADRAVATGAEATRWWQATGLALTAGLIGAGISGISGHSHWQLPLAGTGAGLAAIAAGAGARAQRRSRRVAQAAERIAPLVGLSDVPRARLDRLLRVRWPLGARDSEPPRRVLVCPPASCQLTEAALLERIADVAGRALQTQLQVLTVHRRRHELVLIPARIEYAAQAEVTPREIRCAEAVVEQRLGPTAGIVATDFETDDDGDRQLTSLDVRFPPSVRTTEPRFWTEFEAAFNRQVPGRWHASTDLVTDRQTGQASCHIRRRSTLPTRIPYDLDLLGRRDEHELPYAIDEHGEAVTWSLTLSPHMLVSGAARSGKSSTIRNLVRGFVARGWAALVCDPRRTGLLGMRGWPGVRALGTTADTPYMVAIIEYVHTEMNRRYAAVESGLIRRGGLEPILLVLDEFRELREEIRLWWAHEGAAAVGKKRSSEPPTFELIGSMARQGGEVGVHLLLGVKRPDLDAAILPEAVKDNCRSRCSHGALTREESLAMWDNPDIGRSVPPMIQGRATALRADGTPGEVQSLWLPDPLGLDGDDVALYRDLEPTESPHRWLKAVDGALVETWTRPQTPWTEAAPEPIDPIEIDDQTWEEVDTDPHEWDLRYGGRESVPAGDVGEADLVEIDEFLNIWVVVDHIASDPDEPDLLYIDGRVVDSGQPKTIVAAEDAPIARRRQHP